MRNPNSLKNLRPFKKGVSGNPSGKAKNAISLPVWREFAMESPGVDQNGNPLPCRDRNVMMAIYLSAIDRRRKDHIPAARLWMSYVHGDPTQTVNVGAAKPGETLGTSERRSNEVAGILMAAAARVGKAIQDSEPAAEEGQLGEPRRVPQG